MESIEKRQYNLKQKASGRSPITIERLKKWDDATTQQTLSYSVNFQLISVQRMDAVLHLVQRKLFKQREQQIFANYMQMYASSSINTVAGNMQTDVLPSSLAEGGSLMRSSSDKAVQTAASSDKRLVARNSGLVKNFQSADRLAVEVAAVKNLALELKSCITDLNLVLQQRIQPLTSDSRKRACDNRISRYTGKTMQSTRVKIVSEPRHMSRVTTNVKPDLRTKPRALPASIERREARFVAGTHLRKKANRQQNSKANFVQLTENFHSPAIVKEHKTDTKRHELDFATLWQQLEDIEKVEEDVRQNLLLMKVDQVSGISAEHSLKIGNEDGVDTYHKSAHTTKCSDPSLRNVSNLYQVPVTQQRLIEDSTNSLQYMPKSSVFRLCNDETWQLAKELTKSLGNDLVNITPKEISSLPDEFLKELFEGEFTS